MILRFGLVGALTTAVDIGLFALLAPLVDQAGFANLVSYSAGIALSFVLNRAWTFRASHGSGLVRPAARFLISNLAGLGLSTALVGVLANVVPALAAKVIAVPIVFCWNFALAKAWVFPATGRRSSRDTHSVERPRRESPPDREAPLRPDAGSRIAGTSQ